MSFAPPIKKKAASEATSPLTHSRNRSKSDTNGKLYLLSGSDSRANSALGELHHVPNKFVVKSSSKTPAVIPSSQKKYNKNKEMLIE